MKRGPGTARPRLTRTASSLVALALGAAATGTGPATADAASPSFPSSSYAFARGAKAVEGAQSSSGAKRLTPGETYRGTLGAAGDAGGTRYYRVDLDAKDNAYVSFTAVPPPGAAVSYGDGIKVHIQDRDGNDCSTADAVFGATESPRPISAAAQRPVDPGSGNCQTPGAYYAVVERVSGGGGSGSGGGTWDLELHYATEPVLKGDPPGAPPDDSTPASPAPPHGGHGERRGGAGFGSARGLTEGGWQDHISPGQTLFYRVPVNWGRRMSVGAELGSAPGADDAGYVASALVVSVYNPVRGLVDDAVAPYSGSQRTAAPKPLPTVAYANRFSSDARLASVRFAGWYYVVVNLASDVRDRVGDGPFGLTLDVTLDGSSQEGPGYAGTPAPADEFTVTSADEREARAGGAKAPGGTAAGGSPRDARSMRLLAAGAFGLGVLLMATLGLWTLLARRRARRLAAAAPAADTGGQPVAGAPGGYGYPPAYGSQEGGGDGHTSGVYGAGGGQEGQGGYRGW
ncbi:hypothetical protein [Streptomyces sp. NPDC050560]|uniref:hypothetical protein n=1 Tax=Streptomyces sp. NPDC050560 TaxID=3365630 RepID=UPI0037987B43